MRARKCDRCGKLYEHFTGLKKNKENANAIITIDKDLEEKYWSRKSYDFCPECMNEFIKFLGGGKDNG